MKKNARKLMLSKETLRDLENGRLSDMDVQKALGGLSHTCIQISDCSCVTSRTC